MAIPLKTTLELPDRLMRRIRVRAAQTDRTIKDVVTELIARGLQEEASRSEPPRMDLTQFIGKWPRYKSIDELNAWMDELRTDRDVDA